MRASSSQDAKHRDDRADQPKTSLPTDRTTDSEAGSGSNSGGRMDEPASVEVIYPDQCASDGSGENAQIALAAAATSDAFADGMASSDGAASPPANEAEDDSDLSQRTTGFRRTVSEDDPELLDGQPVDGEQLRFDDHDETLEKGLFPIVGIGASAGGLESLERLFRSMPVDTGMAFVVIQHLSPDFKSLMDELLARYTAIPISRAVDGMPVRPNCVYLIPPKKEMIISGRRLLLTDKDPKQALTMPIDRFFRSLAQDAGKFAIGVILSGSGSDGSRGIRDIHHAGGLILCESQQTAKFDGMPVAAMGTGDVDGVMAPEEMPNALIRHAAQLVVDPVTAEHAPEPEGMETVFRLLNDAYGIDFSHYKPNTVGRRIQRRLSLNHDMTLDDYAERLRTEPDELNVLYRDLLIGVTRFFRDVEAYEKLESDVIPELIRKTPAGEEIRVWVAGCATGEEAYSLAILLHEQIEKEGRQIKAKLFATDVHRRSLAIANEGIYSEEALADVTPERLQRYFDRRPDGYHVVSDLRQMIVFASHNVIKDAPFTKIDLISCRNLLIYFRPLTQRKAISLFHFGLKTGGILLLGPSETPSELQDEFDTLDAHWKLFRKRRDVRLPADLRLPLSNSPLLLRASQAVASPPSRGVPDPSLIGAYDVILDRYMPPGLLINERRELLHTFGGAEKYLHFKRGRPTSDVFDLLDSDLRTAVVGAVQRVLKDGKLVRYAGVRLTTSAGEERLDLTVEPVDNTRSRFAQILIVLRPLPTGQEAHEAASPSGEDAADSRRMSRDRIESLEQELRYSKENLQATIEELETSNEEMQATNEELVASNEELQSTNEELQSVNEELFTVNAEYQKKITELSELSADMDNLLESTDVGTIFLDSNLTIRKFTPQIGQAFHLLPQDIGRPIDSFAHSMLHDQLVEDLHRVVETNERCEKEVRDRQGKWLYLRILPYRTKTRMDGVVLTLIDVSSLKKAEGKLAEAVRLRDEFLAMLSHELRNPLGAILNATSLMKLRSPEDEVLAEACEIVDRQSRHLARLLDDLLDVSRVTQRKIVLERKPIRVAEFVRNAVDAATPLLQNNDLDFCEETEGLDELCVDGDSARLQQALSNVLTNAAKYTPRGGRVVLKVCGDDNDVVLCVRDTGVGIAPDRLESIFDLFVQENSPLHRSAGGMGIGLTLTRSIVERHDGTIRACSDGSGHGSEFEIRLPRIDASGVPAAPRKRVRQEPLQKRVLIVEDDSDNRTMLAMLLEVEQCEVFTAENGPKGLAALEQHRPEVALIDIGLPGLNGYEVARRARSDPQNDGTLLIALTGYGQASDVAKAQQAGFDDHLVKPLDPNRLRTILAKHQAATRSI